MEAPAGELEVVGGDEESSGGHQRHERGGDDDDAGDADRDRAHKASHGQGEEGAVGEAGPEGAPDELVEGVRRDADREREGPKRRAQPVEVDGGRGRGA